ncbi:hypothetical protein F7725_012316 [Dissostichus mawsoni]|uniref:Uncharacterized protein n=1 Tax=Dissostichus mawsoni TaxID=36200 RepID=A0A7J5YM05_DISMA|nr:hypothetical protein F7725_012316 [Dissostichus mawsoni]
MLITDGFRASGDVSLMMPPRALAASSFCSGVPVRIPSLRTGRMQLMVSQLCSSTSGLESLSRRMSPDRRFRSRRVRAKYAFSTVTAACLMPASEPRVASRRSSIIIRCPRSSSTERMTLPFERGEQRGQDDPEVSSQSVSCYCREEGEDSGVHWRRRQLEKHNITHTERLFTAITCFSPSRANSALSQQRGQDVVQRLVTDGGVELLEGFSCSFSDFQQRITESLPHHALPLVALLGAQALLQDGNYLREDLLSQFPHQIAQRGGEEAQQQREEGGQDLSEGAGGVGHHDLPHMEGGLADHQLGVRAPHVESGEHAVTPLSSQSTDDRLGGGEQVKGDDGPDVRRESFSEGERQVDEHHDVSVSHVGGNVLFTGCGHNIRHQLARVSMSHGSRSSKHDSPIPFTIAPRALAETGVHVSDDLRRHLAGVGGSVLEGSLHDGHDEGEGRSVDEVHELSVEQRLKTSLSPAGRLCEGVQ